MTEDSYMIDGEWRTRKDAIEWIIEEVYKLIVKIDELEKKGGVA